MTTYMEQSNLDIKKTQIDDYIHGTKQLRYKNPQIDDYIHGTKQLR